MVGSIGFVVDASILLLLVYIYDFNILFSRVIAFFIAVLITWIINRNFTFSNNSSYKKGKEYIYYLIIQGMGALLNLLIFMLLIYSFKIFEENLILPLAIASIIVMFFNFFVIKIKIYT